MNIKNLFSGLMTWGRKHSSDLKMGLGTTGVVGGTVLLCKGTIKSCDIIREYREQKQELIDEGAEKKEIRKLKAKAVGKVALTMAPGAVMEAGGLGIMWGTYTKTKTALIGVSLAYDNLQKFTNGYRQEVRERYGEEVDEELAYHFKTAEVMVEDEDGNEHPETVRIYPADSNGMPSPYARYFCYGEAEGAERNFDYNDHFLHAQERAANDCFRARKGFLLNDAYELLGIKRSKSGNRVGWIYDPKANYGDNHVDFRIRVVYREVLDENGNPNGFERVHMIDPNVDGPVEDGLIARGLMDE